MIKIWKQKQGMPLNEREFYLLCQGIKWFGENTNRWALIAKNFLPWRTVKFIQVEFSTILTDSDKSNRFAKMLLMDIPDEKLLSIAAEIAVETIPAICKEEERIDITTPQEETKEKPDCTIEIVRKKASQFEEVDIDRISEFVTMNTEEEQF